MDYSINEIEVWSEKIEETAKKFGLDFYPQEFEIINYKDMLAFEAYSGMPSMYPHWSFGKNYEKLRTLYKYNLTGLPYEMVINSDPCLAYLMKDNTLLLQILTIAHVYGHNDFFKNNRLFKEATDAKYTVEMFKVDADTIRSYINDPSIGYEEVEKILTACHALKLQIQRNIGVKSLCNDEVKKRRLEEYKRDKNAYSSPLIKRVKEEPPVLDKIPLEPEEDLLYFIAKYGDLNEWQKNIVEIVRKETLYFIPQIETKIINEGFASYCHYNILKELDLPRGLYLEFIKRHNDVVAPTKSSINPYYLGFEIFKDIKEKYGFSKIFEVRMLERDQSFLRRYLTEELCSKLNLFQYGKRDSDYVIDEIADENGWKKIRDSLCVNAGMGGVPLIKVIDMSNKDKTLELEHVFDGRELNLNYATETMKHIFDLWNHKIILNSTVGNRRTTLICNENREVVTS